jgi:hypothetical protein
MKMKPLLTLTMTGALLALAASAQDAPIRIQPVPGIEVEPAQPPPNFFPGEEFPEPPEMPPEGWGEPGFGGEMFMPPMPGRYTLLSAHIQQAGKSVPVVLKLDTQTGEVWQLKLTESKFFVNGKVQVRTRMSFEPVAQNLEPHHDNEDHNHGHGEVRRTLPGRPDIDRDEPGDDVEEVPDRPRIAPSFPPIRNPRREP